MSRGRQPCSTQWPVYMRQIYGLGKEVVDLAFRGSVSRIGGMSLADLQREAESFWVKARARPAGKGQRSSAPRWYGLTQCTLTRKVPVDTVVVDGLCNPVGRACCLKRLMSSVP